MSLSRYPAHDGFNKDDALSLVKFAAEHIRLPNPEVIKELGVGPVFMAVRGDKGTRGTVSDEGCLFDYNGTPGWALMWPHGFQEHRDGWRLCHIWPNTARRADCFTAIPNLCLLAAPLERLSDGYGPLVEYLKFHAQEVYNWRPARADVVEKPYKYDEVEWSPAYLEVRGNSKNNLLKRFERAKSERANVLKHLLKKNGRKLL